MSVPAVRFLVFEYAKRKSVLHERAKENKLLPLESEKGVPPLGARRRLAPMPALCSRCRGLYGRDGVNSVCSLLAVLTLMVKEREGGRVVHKHGFAIC